MRGTVLVVDDDPGVRRCLGEFLESEGYKVLSAPNGRAALAVLEDELPSVILIDLAMPVMSGWQLLDALAHYPDLARIPRILMDEREVASGGAQPLRVLAKPLDLGGLASVMEDLHRPRATKAA
jgi:CheY-like chemotaxis protein